MLPASGRGGSILPGQASPRGPLQAQRGPLSVTAAEKRGSPGQARPPEGAAEPRPPRWAHTPARSPIPLRARRLAQRPSLRSPDLGAVLQAIRLHFVTDFWTLPPTLPPSGASSRNSPPPQDRNPFQTSDRRQEKSYIILFGQDAKKTKWGGGCCNIFMCFLVEGGTGCL